MKVEVIKPFRYGSRIFEVGEIGDVVQVGSPIMFRGKPLYDFYVKFENHEPIGVHEREVKVLAAKE